jgi:hypothetical protein
MYGIYTPILLLQAFCVYHAYRNNAEQRWYWFILLFPVIGCLFYIYHSFYNRKSMQTLAEGLREVVNSNYRIEQLEKNLRFSDTVTNRIRLADAYVEIGRHKDAIELYQNCLQGFMTDDPVIRTKLLQAHFSNRDYAAAVGYGDSLTREKDFKHAAERISYAWSLHYNGNSTLAENVFQDMDRSFTNYQHRTEYCKFLIETKKTDDLKSKLSELLEEFELMKGPEKKLYKDVKREVYDLYEKNFRTA